MVLNPPKEYRRAPNGRVYAFADFVKHYGQRAQEKWDQAEVAMPNYIKRALDQGEAGKLEHAQPSVAQPVMLPDPILLDLEGARQIRAECSNHGLRKEMRGVLNMIAKAEDRIPSTLTHELDSSKVPWKTYLAHHPQGEEIIGTGIVKFVAQFMPHITDSNRNNQLRLNFLAQRQNGECVIMHIGRTAREDASIRVFPSMAAAVEASVL